MILTCCICSNQFEPRNDYQRYNRPHYCSDWCRGIGKRNKMHATWPWRSRARATPVVTDRRSLKTSVTAMVTRDTANDLTALAKAKGLSNGAYLRELIVREIAANALDTQRRPEPSHEEGQHARKEDAMV